MCSILERVSEVSAPDATPRHSPYGYVIQPDGTAYALLQEFCHGFVLACLYPEALAEYREEDPRYETVGDESVEVYTLSIPESVDDINVFAFQRFEGAQEGKLPAIRICTSRMFGDTTVDLPKEPCPDRQILTLERTLYKSLEHSPEDDVQMDFAQTTMKKCLMLAVKDSDERFKLIYDKRGQEW